MKERIEALKERVEKAGWPHSYGSMPVVYVNDVIDWLDELQEQPADPSACAVQSEPQEEARARAAIVETIRKHLDAGMYHNREDWGARTIDCCEPAIEWLLAEIEYLNQSASRAVVPPEGLRKAIREYQEAAKARPGFREATTIDDVQRREQRFCDAVNALLEAALSAVDPPQKTPVWDKAEFVRRFAAVLDEAWPDPPQT